MKRFLLLLCISIISEFLAAQGLNIELYEYIRKAPRTDDEEELLSYFVRTGSTKKEQVELIAYWIMNNIRYDVESYQFGKHQSSTWSSTFYSKKAVCAGYANLFKEFCIRIGIDCEVISGYAKGYRYKENHKFRRSNHSWNVVLIDKEPYLFDITWASGYVSESNGSLKYMLHPDPEHLFAKPTAFIEKHLPSQRQWQLLDKPITLDRFQKFASYEQMFDSSAIAYYYRDSIWSYMDLDNLERLVSNAEENIQVNPNDTDIPIYFEQVAYAYTRDPTDKESLLLSVKYYERAQSLHLNKKDKERCSKGIDYALFYIDGFEGD